jgi:ribosomal protein S18 acetylase RimI-like enzyme
MIVFMATTEDDYNAFARLVREYIEWCRDSYKEEEWFMRLTHQWLEHELEGLAASYGPPHGRVLLARHEGEICGCGAYHKLTDEICEMKRLFVPVQFRGRGYGRTLCEALLESAKEDQFKLMRLDTACFLTEAIAMYESLGFRRCAPYNAHPDYVMPHIVFMERPL